jgi:branched-chain amino acid transport system ATP-binding protein
MSGDPPTGPDDGLVLTGIGVRFGGLVALADVSMRVPPAGVVGVIGPNGSGKTTLFNVVCGFVRAHSGTLSFDGRPLRPRPHRLARLGIARTLQGLGLFGGLTILENVMVGATTSARAGWVSGLLGLPGSDRDERRLRASAMAQLDALGIAGHAQALPGTVPYAVRKRVALARALVAGPRLLLLDEPAGGLGADEIEELARLIRGLPRPDPPAGGCAVLLVEHHMDLVMTVCDEVVVLDSGRVVAAGPPEAIRTDQAVADAYLGAEVGAEVGAGTAADAEPAAGGAP